MKIKFNKFNFQYMLFTFFLISIFCFFLEILYSLIFKSKFVIPGVLYGPWCPIYGITFVFLLLLIDKREKKQHNLFKIYLTSVLMEYLASLISDKIFGKIIWDYSNYFFNINGRVCLHMSILFTLLAYLAFYYIEPLIKKLYNFLGKKVYIINIELLCLFIFDLYLKLF